MKYLKKYMLLLSALVFITLGAALPYVTTQMLDTQISEFQKRLELSTVNLTLRQESDVEPVLRLISKEHTESVWEGETILTKADVSRAALAVMEALDQYGLLSEGDLEQFLKGKGNVEANLLVAGDGSSALIWSCTWDCSPVTFITIDDATGKAVRILAGNAQTKTSLTEEIYIQLEKWNVFLQDYYDIELTEVRENSHRSVDSLPTSFVMCFSSKDGAIKYELNLETASGYTFFNYQRGK